jgi:hypothetical protein
MVPQHDYVIANNTGLNVRNDINSALAAIVSNNSGDTEPADTFPFMFWADTTDDLLKIRNEADNGWITIGSLTAANLGALLKSGGTMTGALLHDDGTDLSALPAAFDGDPNTGFYRVSADIWGLVAAGAELLRIDGVAGFIKLLGTKALQLAIGTTAERPTGAEGLIRANSTTKKIEAYINAGWQSLNDFSGFTAVVGSGAFCTHATLADALADTTNVPAGSRILVTSNETVNTTIAITLSNQEIVFMPGVTLTNGTAGTGITVGAAGCRIKGGRFSGFTTAISVTDTFNHQFVTECRFASCTTDILDNNTTPNNLFANNINE